MRFPNTRRLGHILYVLHYYLCCAGATRIGSFLCQRLVQHSLLLCCGAQGLIVPRKLFAMGVRRNGD